MNPGLPDLENQFDSFAIDSDDKVADPVDPVEDEPNVISDYPEYTYARKQPSQQLCSFCWTLSQSARLQSCGQVSTLGRNDAYKLGIV